MFVDCVKESFYIASVFCYRNTLPSVNTCFHPIDQKGFSSMCTKFFIAGIGLLALSFTAAAEDAPAASSVSQTPSIFAVSGFGTIGVARTNTNDAVFSTTTVQPNGYGATRAYSFEPDTKFGAQLDARFTDAYSATVQVMSKENVVGSYQPDLEWAFAKAKLGDGFSVRVGRIGAPFFMTSDFRSVGYTNLTVRTPTDVYGAVPIRTFDGADVLYQKTYGDVVVNAQFFGGRSSTLIGTDENLELHRNYGLNFSAEMGPVTIRFGRSQARMETEGTGAGTINALMNGLSTLGAYPGLGSLSTLSNDLTINNKFATFTGLGATVELQNWVGSAELTRRQSDSELIENLTGWYTTLGYHIGAFTPYVSLSGQNADSTSASAPAALAYYPATVQGPASYLIGAVNSAQNLKSESEKAIAFGSRWDAGKNYDVKAEVQVISVPGGSSGIFSPVQGGGSWVFPSRTNVPVFSLCVDFVF
jgi:hypothetical protein